VNSLIIGAEGLQGFEARERLRGLTNHILTRRLT